MRRIKPHEHFRIEFDTILQEATRQAELDPNNSDEVTISIAMHAFFVNEVFPSIATNDWVYAATVEFAERYAIECFQYWKQKGAMVFKIQSSSLDLKETIQDFVKRADMVGAVRKHKVMLLDKASDFMKVIKRYELSSEMREEADALHEQAKKYERDQLYITTEAIQLTYSKVLPRIMHVLRRVIKGNVPPAEQRKYDNLQDISNMLDWYKVNIDSSHPLAPVTTKLGNFYRVIRNVASHPEDFAWEPENNRVIFTDQNSTLSIHQRELMQTYRILVYLCEYALRGICAAFSEREQGHLANKLIREYHEIFPENFPDDGPVTVELYKVNFNECDV